MAIQFNSEGHIRLLPNISVDANKLNRAIMTVIGGAANAVSKGGGFAGAVDLSVFFRFTGKST